MSTDRCLETGGSFSVRIENVFCGAEGYTCAKGIKIVFLDTEIDLMTGTDPVINQGAQEVTITQERCGMFLKYGAFGKFSLFYRSFFFVSLNLYDSSSLLVLCT